MVQLDSLKRIFRGMGYTLALIGASVGGFPPPRPFARDELPEEVIERVMLESELDAIDGWESEWGFRIDRSPPRHPRAPEAPSSHRR